MSEGPLWKTLEDAMEREFAGGGGLVDLALAAWVSRAGVWVPDAGLYSTREWWRSLAERLGLVFERAFVDERGAIVCSTVEEGTPLEARMTWVDAFHARRLASWALDEFGAGERWLIVRMGEDAVGPEDRRALSAVVGLRLREQDGGESLIGFRWAEVLSRFAKPERDRLTFDLHALRASCDAITCSEAAWRGIGNLLERLGQHPELEGGNDGYLAAWVFRLGYALAVLREESEASEESLRRVLPAALDARTTLLPEARLQGGTVRGILRSLSTLQVR
ncbi:MAG: hypothetical protein H6834_06805 [Planctomycetes bacterium]|nr:hypothetical protein [Planctomycetota bacterium]